MGDVEQLVDEVVLAFRQRLVEVGEEMGKAHAPDTFVAAERELVQMARELAAQLTGRILQGVSNDKSRRKEAMAAVRKKADTRGIEVRSERDRMTPIRTLGVRWFESRRPTRAVGPEAG